MFACIYWRSVSKSEEKTSAVLVDLAFEFSPLVEQAAPDTVVLDIGGHEILFGGANAQGTPAAEIEAAYNLANEIARRGKALNLKINVAAAANPDVAIHAAHSFKGVSIIPTGEECSTLKNLSLKTIDYSLVEIDAKRAEEIQETFALWGIRTFADLGALPLSGVAERLGQDGVRLQKLAQGKTDRRLNLVRPPIGFAQQLELEHAVCELEPLAFILSRLLNQLCANLTEYALATNELKLQLKLQDQTDHQRGITLSVPMRNPKTLLRLLLFDIEAHPPPTSIIAVTISAEPVKPRAAQSGLFIPLAPEPEKLEITLARLAKLVGQGNVGSPDILDTHRPDAFRMKKFHVRNAKNGSRFALNAGRTSTPTGLPGRGPRLPALPVMGFRIFRPPWRAEVRTTRGKPLRIDARSEDALGSVRGQVVCAAGPWRASGEWWRSDVWARDEWDIAVVDTTAKGNEVLCRIFRDLTSEQWFVAGVYD